MAHRQDKWQTGIIASLGDTLLGANTLLMKATFSITVESSRASDRRKDLGTYLTCAMVDVMESRVPVMEGLRIAGWRQEKGELEVRKHFRTHKQRLMVRMVCSMRASASFLVLHRN